MPSREYYDPVKAREYYLRTRELKGRKAAADEPKSSKAKKSAKKSAAKSEAADKRRADQKQVSEAVNAEKKIKLAALKEDNKALTIRLRGIATMKRAAISERLKAFMEQVSDASSEKSGKISEQNQKEREKIASKRKFKSEKLAAERKAKAEKISEDAANKIKALPPMPKQLDRNGQREWRKAHAKKVEGIRGAADSDRTKVYDESSAEIDKLNAQTSAEREKANANTRRLKISLREGTGKIKDTARDQSSGQKEQVAAELKTSLGTARANYDSKKKALVDKYKKISDTEKRKVS